MIDKLSDAIMVQNVTLYEAFSKVFENPQDIVDFHKGCREYHSLNAFLKVLDDKYENLKVLNKLPGDDITTLIISSKGGNLVVFCKLKPEFVPKKNLPTIIPLLGYVYMESLKSLYPRANEETLKAFKEFIWDNTCCAGGAELATELLKSWNRQLNDGDDYIVLRAKDVKSPFVTHKFCINKKDLY